VDSVMMDYLESLGSDFNSRGRTLIDLVRCENGTCPATPPSPTNTPVVGCPPGDANDDQSVNLADLRFIFDHYLGGPVECADQNSDSLINGLDLGEVLLAL